MKTMIKGFLILTIVMGTGSCDDFLTEDPKGRLATEAFFNSPEDLQMSLNSLFYNVAMTSQSDGNCNYAWTGDDITTHPQSNKQQAREFDYFQVSDNNAFNAWGVYFTVVKSANFVINNAAKTPTDESNIKSAIAQARFWRAYAYYMLVRIYGPLPVMLEEKIDYAATLTSVKDIYETIIVEDLKFAEANLPVDFSSSPQKINGVNVYATEGSAKALLAHVYLSMAGWPLKQTDKYGLAAAKAKEVIDGTDNGRYDYILHHNYADIYLLANNFSKENVIAVHYNKAWGWADNTMCPLTGLFESAGGGWSDYWGEIKFWAEMPDGPRKDAVYAPKIYQSETGQLVDWWETWENHPEVIVVAEGPNHTEYDYTKGAVGVDWLGEKSHKIFRYAEVLLTYAEAQARADGSPNAQAYQCVNKVRQRAGLNDLQPGLSGSDFADAVVQEHGWEVAGYFWGNIACRYFDMQRLELLEAHFNYRKTNPDIVVAPGISRKETIPITAAAWSESMMYAPYPAVDKAMNPNLHR